MSVILRLRRAVALAICPSLCPAPASTEHDPEPLPVFRSRRAVVPSSIAVEPLLAETDISLLIQRLADVRGWKLTYASRMATGSGDTLQRIAAGVGLTIRRANAIIARCSELLPEGHDWPADIARPPRARKGEAGWISGRGFWV